ncbi:MAG TPA: SCO family protein [Acidimicrobiales bacterium]|jgi:cytochrome oxidase Cu insertion factor (SCO1/SenC/PrrC family)
MGKNTLSLTNPFVVSIFHHHLYVTSVYWIIGIGLVLLLAATLLRRLTTFNLSPAGLNEPRSRTILRIGFGVIWVIDGILQFQPSMPLGLGDEVVRPTVAGAPWFLHPVMNHAISLWNAHPVSLATGTAWIQVGIGLGLIVSNGVIGRGIAIVAAGWAGLIWLVGEGAGGAFAKGASILFGWPGATVFYFVAAIWIAAPPGFFAKHFSRWTLRFLAAILLIGAILQCLPDAEFWHGGNSNALTAMTTSMTATDQPHALAWIVRHGGDLAGTLGGGFNVAVILWLVACAAGLWLASTRPLNWPIVALGVGALLVWVVAEDIAIFGGVGTDINSMVPIALLAFCARPAYREALPFARRLPEEFRSSSGAVAAAFAAGMIIFSVVSMGVASVSAAESSFFVAENGASPLSLHQSASSFTLTDQFDKSYTLGEHKGRATLLTFLDPVCWTDCPLLAAQLRQVRSELPASAPLDIVIVAANPLHETLGDVRHFIAIHDLSSVPNLFFLTGKTKEMKTIWKTYGIDVQNVPGDVMSIHLDYMFIINSHGTLRWELPDDPAYHTAITNGVQESSESVLLSLLHQSGLG